MANETIQNPIARRISFNIFAASDEEALRAEKSLKAFIRMMGEKNIMVSGNKIAEAISKLDDSPFIKNEIMRFFQKQ